MKRSSISRTNTAVSCRTRSRTAFTLTELLIVMAILVLLVSLVGPRLLRVCGVGRHRPGGAWPAGEDRCQRHERQQP